MSAASDTSLAGIALEKISQQIIIYVGNDNRLYKLAWDSTHQWQQNPIDLIELVHRQSGVKILPPTPDGFRNASSPLTCSATNADVEAQIYYVDDNSAIQGITSLGAFVKMPQLTGDDAPAKGTPLSAYEWSKQNSRHLLYIDVKGRVRELYYSTLRAGGKNEAPNWQNNDLSANTGAELPSSGSALCGYTFENEGTEHVIYVDAKNAIRELYYSGGRWSTSNLSATTGAPAPMRNTPLACYVCEYENTQHVIYLGVGGNVHELYWSGTWQKNDLTSKTNTPKPITGSKLAGYACEYEKTEHVIFVGNDGAGPNLQEIYRSGNSWNTTNLSQSAGSGVTPVLTNPPSSLTGYSFEAQRTEHVVYIDTGRRVHELYRSGNAWNAGMLR